MKLSAPVLTGLVVGVIVFALANNGSADEPRPAAGSRPSLDADASDGVDDDVDDGISNDDDAGDAETGSGDDDPAGEAGSDDGRASDDGQASDDDGDGFPDTGGATVPALPAPSAGVGAVTLTFDDGPHATYTPQILDLLAAHDATAVFCVVGEQVRRHPEMVQRIVAEGHALCNHTDSHDAELTERSTEVIGQEIDTTTAAISAAVPHAEASFFRQPARFVTPKVAPVARERGLTILDWTIDTRDWARPGASAIVKSVVDQVQPGSVILLHDGGGNRTQTVQALAQILTMLTASGYQTVIPETG